jgi:spermidine/putrescine transport system permease protein
MHRKASDILFLCITRLILILTGTVILLPLFAVLATSVSRQTTPSVVDFTLTFHWYRSLFDTFSTEMWLNSLSLSVFAGAIAGLLSAILVMNYWDSRRIRKILIVVYLGITMPAAAYAASLAGVQQWLMPGPAHLGFLIAADVIWALPFSFAVTIASVAKISKNEMRAAAELTHASGIRTAVSIVLPQARSGLLVGFLIATLLTFNEYVRATYLGGATALMTKSIYGQMASGADPSVYALGGMNIAFCTAALAIVYVMRLVSFHRIRKP